MTATASSFDVNRHNSVTSSDERYTIIEFDNHGRRVFITDMVTLGQTDEPAPKKKSAGRRKQAADTSAVPS